MLQHTKACQIPKFKVGLESVALWQLLWRIKWIMPQVLGRMHLSRVAWLGDFLVVFTTNMKLHLVDIPCSSKQV